MYVLNNQRFMVFHVQPQARELQYFVFPSEARVLAGLDVTALRCVIPDISLLQAHRLFIPQPQRHAKRFTAFLWCPKGAGPPGKIP